MHQALPWAYGPTTSSGRGLSRYSYKLCVARLDRLGMWATVVGVMTPPAAWPPHNEDRQHSPFSGLTREHWLQAARYLIHGYMANESARDEGPARPRFEGRVRSLLIAAHVIREEPTLTLAGTPLVEWYRESLSAAFASSGPAAIEHPGDRQRSWPLVEIAGLVIGCWLSGDRLWAALPAATQTRIIDACYVAGTGTSNGHNWRFFNVLCLTFASEQGLAVDLRLIRSQLQGLLAWSVGDGWYRDGTAFDGYNAWAFHFYAALWTTRPLAQEFAPEAAALQVQLQRFLATWPRCFSRQGKSVLWGRSALYRCAASAPLAAAFLHHDCPLPAGQTRRLLSGNLRQFLDHPQFLQADGLPAAGFYGPFPPAVQSYSKRGSAWWLGKAFVSLLLPATHALWREPECEDPEWPPAHAHRTTPLPGPGLLIVNHGDGSSELISARHRPGKRDRDAGDYARLAYHSAFPWTPANDQLTPMGLAICSHDEPQRYRPTIGQRRIRVTGDLLIKQLIAPETFGVVDTALIPIPHGMILIHRFRLARATAWRLASYALPDDGHGIEEAPLGEHGRQAFTQTRRVGFVPVSGWSAVETLPAPEPHAEGLPARVLCASGQSDQHHGLPLAIAVLYHQDCGGAYPPELSSPLVDWHSTTTASGGLVVHLHLSDGRHLDCPFDTVEAMVAD